MKYVRLYGMLHQQQGKSHLPLFMRVYNIMRLADTAWLRMRNACSYETHQLHFLSKSCKRKSDLHAITKQLTSHKKGSK